MCRYRAAIISKQNSCTMGIGSSFLAWSMIQMCRYRAAILSKQNSRKMGIGSSFLGGKKAGA
jgi:hypothetical protein